MGELRHADAKNEDAAVARRGDEMSGERSGHDVSLARAFYAGLCSRAGRAVALASASASTGLYALREWWPQLHAEYAAPALPAVVGASGLLGLALVHVRGRLRHQAVTVTELRELRDEYSLAEDLGSLGSWTYDVAADRYHWSPGTFRVFGVEPELGAPSRRGFFICVHAEDQQRWQYALKRAIRHGERLDVEFRYIKDGRETIWVRGVARPEFDEDAKVVRLTGIAQDVTAARRLAGQLANSEAKFRDLTQMSSDWYWETDAEHRIAYVSDTAEVELGPWVRDWIGQRDWELPAADFPRSDWDGHRATLDKHAPFEGFRVARIDPEGNLVHLELAGRPLFDKDGAFVGYRGVGRDVTRQRQQQVLLQIEGDLAQIIRDRSEPDDVLTQMIVSLCRTMGWAGGTRLARVTGREAIAVRERWGGPDFLKMLADLPAEMPLSLDSVEGRSWASGKAVWLQDVSTQPAFAARYATASLGMSSAFLAPILDEHGHVMSALLFMSPVGFRADHFVGQVAEILSRTLSLYLQRKFAEQRLMHASLHDALTGLPNRVFLTHQLEGRLRREERLAVLYVDLDRYKLINDSLGHSVGDQVLIEVARRFRETIRPDDVAGRMGGDEFVLLLDGALDDAGVEATARRLLAAIEKPFVLNNRAYFLSASIGIALAPRDALEAKALIRCADAAMYRVKSEGRNGLRFHAGDALDMATGPSQLVVDLPGAIQRGELELRYEPQLDVGRRHLAGLEAAPHWRHPNRGLLTQDAFLAAADASIALLRDLARWTLERAVADRAALGKDRWREAPVAVDVAARVLVDEDFVPRLAALLRTHGLPAALLRLEVHESGFTEFPERVVAQIGEVRRLGVQVVIDHFGVGFASLATLKTLPVDGLKIDRGFVAGMADHRGNSAVVEAVVLAASRLGLSAMAEGVCTAAELKRLRELDCLIVQGPLISEPLGAAQLAEFLQSLPLLRAAPQPAHQR